MMIFWIKKIVENKWIPYLITFVIFILCTIPSKELPTNQSFNDKTAHFVAFGVWAFCWVASFKNYVKTLILGCLYGIFIEFWQYILPESFHRGFELLDMLADAIGVIIGLFFYWIFSKISINS